MTPEQNLRSERHQLFYEEVDELTKDFTEKFNSLRQKWFDNQDGITVHALPKDYTGPDALSFYIDVDAIKI